MAAIFLLVIQNFAYIFSTVQFNGWLVDMYINSVEHTFSTNKSAFCVGSAHGMSK